MSDVTYPFRSEPFPYQRGEWEAYRSANARAIFWEQGLGKSKLTIDMACWLYLKDLIDAVVIVAPNGVHRNWVEEEIPAHVPDLVMSQVRAFTYQSERADTKWHKTAVRDVTAHKGFSWFTISYEAFITSAGKRALIDFFDQRRIFYVLDEAHYIKNPDAERTKSILRSAMYALYRRVLTGTPIAVGPFDMYPQIEFLQPGFWSEKGFSTFVEFKKHFGVFQKVWNPTAYNEKTKKRDGNQVDVLVGYRRLPELNDIIRPLSSRLTKEEAGLNLPPKRYRKERFEMTAEQAELYRQMRDESVAWINGGRSVEEEGGPLQSALAFSCPSCSGKRELEIDGYIYPCPECSGGPTFEEFDGTPIVATMAMVRLLRLQQIACGYLPTEDEEEPLYLIPGENRRLTRACDIIQDRVQLHKVIVWARFKYDIDLIMSELKKRGIRAVRYDGQCGDDERAEAKALFKGVRPIMSGGVLVGREEIPRHLQADVFVANQSAGATGLTLNVAKTSLYYSNNFKLIDRLQSEDRNHRIGQDEEVEYIDMIAENTVDDKIVTSHRNKLSIASQILGDKLKEWI